MMALVEILQESKAVSHCDLLSDVALGFISEGYLTFCCALFLFAHMGRRSRMQKKSLSVTKSCVLAHVTRKLVSVDDLCWQAIFF